MIVVEENHSETVELKSVNLVVKLIKSKEFLQFSHLVGGHLPKKFLLRIFKYF